MTTPTPPRPPRPPRPRRPVHDTDPHPAPGAARFADQAPVMPAAGTTAAAVRAALADLTRDVTPELAAPPSDGPQAQGDVIVLPWLASMRPDVRADRIERSQQLPRAGLWLRGSHLLITESGPPARWTLDRRPGSTLGTLVVPAGTVTRLCHDQHPDLRIGAGVYAVRGQRIESRSEAGTSTEPVFD